MARTGSILSLLFQVTALSGLFWLCNQLVERLALPIPAGVVGLVVLVLLLLVRVVPERAVLAGSSWLLGDLLLFFIPPVVSVIKYWVLIREDGAMMISTLVLGTLVVLTGTAWVVDRVFALEKRLRERQPGESAHV